MKFRNDNTERLGALAPFMSRFEAPGFEFGHWIDHAGYLLPEYERSTVGSDFVSTCYDAGWIGKDFDGTEWKSWVEWKGSDEALQLRDDPAALQSAKPEQLGRLLTVLIRQDRFIDGSLACAFESGFLLEILRRVAVLATRGSSSS